MDGPIAFSTLLSRLLVGFTIEFDNEAEHQMSHRTTRHGARCASLPAPWLVSMVMWLNCMQFIGEEGIPVRDLERRARTKTNLAGMERWGYITVDPPSADRRPKPLRSTWIVRATPAGRKAQEVWRPLFRVIENRWRQRFGKDAIAELRQSSWAVASQFEIELPDCLPILRYGLSSSGTDYERRALVPCEEAVRSHTPLCTLLSKVLLAFAIDFEAESDLSLAISANVVRVLDEKGVAARELPLLTGVSKEAIAMSLSFLTKLGYAVVEAAQSHRRAKVAYLTPKGRKAQDTYRRLLAHIEERWQARYGMRIIRSLRESLEQLMEGPAGQASPLLQGLEPYASGWRASVPPPKMLPHYPMVLHRGGFPDGS